MDGRTLGGKTAVFLAVCVFMAVFLAIFGTNYAIVGINVATAALFMLSKDLSVRPLSNLWTIAVFMMMMGLCAYAASMDPLLGLAINFTAVFLIVFLSMQDLKSPLHFPLLLFYTTMVTIPIEGEGVPDRLLALAVSAVFIVGLNILVNRGSRDRSSHNGVIAMCEGIRGFADSVLSGGSPDHAELDEMATELSRRMYDRMKSLFFSTPDDRTALDLVVSIADLGRAVCRGTWSEQALRGIHGVLDTMIAHERGEIGAAAVSESVESYIASNDGIATGVDLILRDIARELLSLESGEGVRERTSLRGLGIRKLVRTIREESRTDSARFTFSVRMALVFSMVAFAWDYWGWENAQIMLLTLIAVVVPFLEDSWKLSLMRLSGTVMGAMVFAVAAFLIGDNLMVLTVLGLFAAYAYVVLDNGRYDRKMFFYTLLVMIVSSFAVTNTGSDIVADRIMFTLAAIALGVIVNRVILPYRIKDENMELAVRSMRISLERIHNIRDILNGRPDTEEEVELAVLSASISQKMMMNADRKPDPLARKFQMRQDSLSIQCSSLYKSVPSMSPECHDVVRRMFSCNLDSDDALETTDTAGLDEYGAECVRRAEGIILTYRKNRKMMFELIVEGYMDDRTPSPDDAGPDRVRCDSRSIRPPIPKP